MVPGIPEAADVPWLADPWSEVREIRITADDYVQPAQVHRNGPHAGRRVRCEPWFDLKPGPEMLDRQLWTMSKLPTALGIPPARNG